MFTNKRGEGRDSGCISTELGGRCDLRWSRGCGRSPRSWGSKWCSSRVPYLLMNHKSVLFCFPRKKFIIYRDSGRDNWYSYSLLEHILWFCSKKKARTSIVNPTEPTSTPRDKIQGLHWKRSYVNVSKWLPWTNGYRKPCEMINTRIVRLTTDLHSLAHWVVWWLLRLRHSHRGPICLLPTLWTCTLCLGAVCKSPIESIYISKTVWHH